MQAVRKERSPLVKFVDAAVIVAALATVPLTVAQLRGFDGPLAAGLDWVVWLVFVANFFVLLFEPRSKGGYEGKHWYSSANLRDAWFSIDLGIVILSFPLLPALFGLVRLARLARLARLGRVGAIGAGGLSGSFGRRRLQQMFLIATLAVIVGGAVMSSTEPPVVGGKDIWSGTWWAIVTTVGVNPGDPGPQTPEGRIVAVILMLCGIGIIATLAAYLVESFIGRPPMRRRPQSSSGRAVLDKRFERALDYAMDVHGDQLRSISGTPFMAHLLGVAALVLEDGGDEDEAVAALLHDVPEQLVDGNAIAAIAKSFGEQVRFIVEGCSIPEEGLSWPEARQRHLQRLREQRDLRVLRVAVAKELQNARALHLALERDGAKVWGRLDGTEQDQRSYLEEIARLKWNGLNSPMIEELQETISALVSAPMRVT
jgi:hypothetical protein